jgi:hypothetical protein
MTADAGPPIPPALPPAPQSPPSNGLGLAGFIVSLVGLILTCGILCPVGLVLSLFGLRKEPRGFAIAGTVIGGIGTLFAVVVVGAIVMLVVEGKEAVLHGAGGQLQTVFALTEAEQTIEMERTEKGRLPDEAHGNALIAEIRDGWKRKLRYEPHDDTFTIRSAGPDGVFGNGDDETSDAK